MSVIVWDGKTLAVDRGINDGHVSVPVNKSWQLDNGVIIAGVGSVYDIFLMKAWVIEGRNSARFPKVSPQSHFVIVSPVSGLQRYSAEPIAISHRFHPVALGSGRDFAYGALAVGATAKQAAEAAAKYCVTCSPEIDVYEIIK